MLKFFKFKQSSSSPRNGKRFGIAALVVTAMLIVAGCGGDNGVSSNDSDNNSEPNYYNPNINYGTLSDTRDGKTYRTVVIGGKTWMAENLNYTTSSGSYCYNDSSHYCAKYGRLYTWSAAITACPNDWSLPSNEEWQTLVDFAGGSSYAGTKLKSKTGWNYDGNGTDSYGFSALPGGYHSSSGNFGAGNYGHWWSATETHSASTAWLRYMYHRYSNVYEEWNGKSYGFSVRCLKD